MTTKSIFLSSALLIIFVSLVLSAELGDHLITDEETEKQRTPVESIQELVSDAKENILEELERGQVRNLKFISKSLSERGFFTHNPNDCPTKEALVDSISNMIKKRTGPFENKKELSDVYQIYVSQPCETIDHEMKLPFATFQEVKENEDVIDNLPLQTLEWITYASICNEIAREKESIQEKVIESVYADPEVRKEKAEDTE